MYGIQNWSTCLPFLKKSDTSNEMEDFKTGHKYPNLIYWLTKNLFHH